MFLAADNVWVTLTLLKVTEVFSFVKGSISAAGSFRSGGPFLKQKMVIEPSFVSYDNSWQTRTGRDEWRLSMTHYNRTEISKSTILRLRKTERFLLFKLIRLHFVAFVDRLVLYEQSPCSLSTFAETLSIQREYSMYAFTFARFL